MYIFVSGNSFPPTFQEILHQKRPCAFMTGVELLHISRGVSYICTVQGTNMHPISTAVLFIIIFEAVVALKTL